VVEALLGTRFGGVLCTDFYSAYGPITSRKQRCLVHLLRDARELRDEHPDETEVQRFCAQLIALVRRGFRLKASRQERGEDSYRAGVQRYIRTFANAFIGVPFRPCVIC
jgi:hypothetical protein